ncbi:MAG: pilus assembly protein TadG [Rhodoplanes sp.]|uniref:TadE/TadG family type IV pilus assembly protein n=1 Tax=Rhodoplanes sp. TaxID=1968906 RepID=UPI0017B50E68|nr:TadE/TadG family type IV pilus assembly protein [Rhodoplanes sp.]NVO17059.1 pilus assembly protein TadG [Rhodoplanes sp.]
MSTNTLLPRASSQCRAFRRAEGGNVAVMFALTLIPVVGLVGAAIDYSRANAIRANMQAAADSAALAVSKIASSQTSDQIQAAADANFRALITQQDATITGVSAAYTKSAVSNVVVDATGTMKTRFMGLLGFSQMNIKVTSTTAWGNTRLRVALALDNTGSMASSNKIGALQTATKNLLTQLQAAATNDGDVYVSIIPFSRDVNVGTGYSSATWIDWTSWDADDGNGSCSKSQYSTKSSCTSHSGTWTVDAHSTWNGCITDRGTSSGPSPSAAGTGYDQRIDAPVVGTTATLFPADQYGYCPLAMKGLSYEWTNMKTLVDNMYPNGSTNQPIGLVWGWQSLVGGGPLTAPAKDANYQYQQVIILLSDGLNTQDRWYGNGSSTSTAVDARMCVEGTSSCTSGTCNNIKAAGITIYTIQVNTGGDPTSTLLQKCATDSSKFYLLTSSSQIITAFDQIGTQLTRLRVAK